MSVCICRWTPLCPVHPFHPDSVEAKARLADGGLVCEEHPLLPWPHGDCAGPGMLREDVES